MGKLLVVEDDDDVSTPLVQILTTGGHAVALARDGYEGLSAVVASPPDLIVLDIEMPRRTGPEMAYDLLIANCGKEAIPILLLSGASNLRQVARMVGTPYVLAKPFDIECLLSLIRQALEERIPPRPQPNPVDRANASQH